MLADRELGRVGGIKADWQEVMGVERGCGQGIKEGPRAADEHAGRPGELEGCWVSVRHMEGGKVLPD